MVGWLGVVLRRATHDRALVIAAALVVLVASGVLVATTVYPEAIVRAGIARTLTAADPVASGVSVRIEVPTDAASTFDATVRAAVGEVLQPAAGMSVLVARSADYDMPRALRIEPPVTTFVYAEAIETHVHLVQGRWPADSPDTIEAAVSEQGAAALELAAGAQVGVISRLDGVRRFTVHIVGVFAPTDPAEPYWAGDRFLLGGSEQRGPFTTLGPLFVSRSVLLERTVGSRVTCVWRSFPAFADVTPSNAGSIAANVRGLADRLRSRLGSRQAVTVVTSLPDLLGTVSNRLAQAGAGSVLVAGQIVVLAMYAVILVAALVVGQRRAGTSLVRARGASALQLVGLAVLEGLVVAGLTAVLGIPLGVGLAVVLAGLAPGASAGHALPAALIVTPSIAWLVAAAGIVAVVGLSLPTIVAVGPLARIRRSAGRERAATLIQRARIDLALVVLGVVALWRLREAGSADVAATPLAASGPAIGLLAGGILLLRFVPLMGRALERLLVRGRTVAAFGVRSVARRSAAYARPALLFAMSAAIGVVAAGYGRTWQGSQRDQAAFAVGADIRGDIPPGGDAPGATDAGRFLGLASVTAATPVAHQDFASESSVRRGMLVAVVPGALRGVAAGRPDVGTRPLPDMLAELDASRPDPGVLALPDGTRRIRIRPAADVRPVGDTTTEPLTWDGLSLDIVVRTRDGLLARLRTAPEVGSSTAAFIASLPAAEPDPQWARADVLAIELHFRLAGVQAVTGTIGLASLDTSLAAEGDSWAPLEGAGAGLADWGLIRGTVIGEAAPMPAVGDDRAAIAGRISDEDPLRSPGATFIARPNRVTELGSAPLPALVDSALLSATSTNVGDVLPVRQGFATIRRLGVLGSFTAFPGVGQAGAAVVDLGSLQLSEYIADGTIEPPDEWRLSIEPGRDRPVMAALASGSPRLQNVRSWMLETEARLDDPIALVVGGMLLLSSAAAAAFAAIGFVAAAWASTSARIPEYAVARALGLTGPELRRWLVVEQAFPTLVGVAWGIGLGLLLEWLVLPTITVAPDGRPAIPPARIVVPLDLVAGYVAVAAILVVVTAFVLTGTVRRAGLTQPLRTET